MSKSGKSKLLLVTTTFAIALAILSSFHFLQESQDKISESDTTASDQELSSNQDSALVAEPLLSSSKNEGEEDVILMQPVSIDLTDSELLTLSKDTQDCQTVPVDEQVMAIWREEAIANEEYSEDIWEMADAYQRCLNVPRDYNYLESFEYLALKGNTEALERYFEIYDTEIYDVLQIHKHDREGMIAAREKLEGTKTRLLEANILLGNEEVLRKAIWGYSVELPEGYHFLTPAYLLREITNNSDHFEFADEYIRRFESWVRTEEEEQLQNPQQNDQQMEDFNLEFAQKQAAEIAQQIRENSQ